MTELEVWKALAWVGWGLSLPAMLLALALLVVLSRSLAAGRRQVELLLLLGKSTTPGEAVAAVEKLSRLERAREELLAQRERSGARVSGGSQPEVARKESPSRKWFGHRHRPTPAQE